ncbi:hypothetical protein [Aquimarina algiphila]|uniref:Nuclear transport factor 2 family protein n=1 Tax=Aquimarina algiphila TaxID=2047982 RepID=A0A554VK30_9FLAO|nr:hypothetical protein [Aquimarina algiphila]TSE08313.1 hypothetical protein FOF46_13025 [Aquimarina algiphila]
MKKTTYLISLLMFISFFNTCGQIGNHEHKEVESMNLNSIKNNIVKQAFEAWQQGDSKLWFSFFTNDAQLYDDGKLRDFNNFSTNAIGEEWFTSLDKVENEGLSIYRKIHTKKWGDFKTYFKFYINDKEKIYRLEIGQADY